MAVPQLTHLMMMTMAQNVVTKMWMVGTSLLFTVMVKRRTVTKMWMLWKRVMVIMNCCFRYR